MALDASGFVRRVQFFAGNASEPATLKGMLSGLHAAPGATVVMDAGIAAQSNLTWLREQGYHYVVVSKLRERQFDPSLATTVQSAGDVTIKLQRVDGVDPEGRAEVRLYCHSPAREEKDRAIDTAKASALELALTKLQAGLSTPKGKAGSQDVATVMQRLGRAKQRYARAAQHYDINVATDPEGKIVTAITWVKRIVPGSAAAHPGVYCLRTTLVEQDNATLWRTYILLTELESVFRSLKTDLGLRPVFHRIDRRVEGALVHQRAGLPLRAHAAPAAQGPRHPRQLEHPASSHDHPAPGHRHPAAPRWSRRARAQGHAPQATAPDAGHHPQARPQPRANPPRAGLSQPLMPAQKHAGKQKT